MVCMRCTPLEHEALKRAAEARKLPVADYLRHAAAEWHQSWIRIEAALKLLDTHRDNEAVGPLTAAAIRRAWRWPGAAMADYATEQNFRLAQQMLKQQSEINELAAENRALRERLGDEQRIEAALKLLDELSRYETVGPLTALALRRALTGEAGDG